MSTINWDGVRQERHAGIASALSIITADGHSPITRRTVAFNRMWLSLQRQAALAKIPMEALR